MGGLPFQETSISQTPKKDGKVSLGWEFDDVFHMNSGQQYLCMAQII